MGVFVCADDTSGICRGLVSFFEKCIFTEKSEMVLVHKSFSKSKTGLAHDCNPWQSLPDLCLWGRRAQKKSCKEGKGQLKGKIRK